MGTEENLEQGMLFGTILIHRFELKKYYYVIDNMIRNPSLELRKWHYVIGMTQVDLRNWNHVSGIT